jgi:hypothetical protein
VRFALWPFLKSDGPINKLRQHVVPVSILGAIALVASVLVALTLRTPTIDAYPPTPALPAEVGDTLVGPVRYTVDARSPDRWVFFDFSRGSVIDQPGPLDWDIAFRRFRIIVNGGPGYDGRGAIADLGDIAFEDVTAAPDTGWVASTAGRDSANAALLRWYEYGWSSHILRPKPRVYAIRTADGKYAKLRIVSYYCPGATPGCITFEYVYAGGGGISTEDGNGQRQHIF